MSRNRRVAASLAIAFLSLASIIGIALGQTSGQRPVWDSAMYTWVTTDTLLKGDAINDQYQSGVLDFRTLGGIKTLYIRGTTAAGSASPPIFYVAIDGMFSSTNDSLNFFRFPLGASQPYGGSQISTSGTFRALLGSATMDSTTSRAAWSMALVDSVTGSPFDSPYGRIHVWTAGVKVQNVWLIIKSRGK